ncbi:MAG: glycosyltransferase [Pseudomonadota bacterium]
MFRPPRPKRVTLSPALSFETGIIWPQIVFARLLATAIGVTCLLSPSVLFAGLSLWLWATFLCLICWRFFLIMRAIGVSGPICAPETCAEHSLPVYSVLVPLHDEAAVIDQLAKALGALDWPADKLDIILLVEPDDVSTHYAIAQAVFPPGTRILQVPDHPPRTKPKALNHGLMLAYGDLVCIFDAEDRPDPQQLRKAHAAFEAAGPNMACVQAALVADNGDQSWLAAHWGLDYAVQFGLLVPAMADARLPIALGGTSNHFRRAHLEAVGGWDAFNVTEDADLGLRFAAHGLDVGTIDSFTLEDAPIDWLVWHRQRGRWIKGFMQTWLVLMRRPATLYRLLGPLRFLAMQLSLGGAILAPLIHAPMMLFVAMIIASGTAALSPAGTALLVFGLVVSVLGDSLAPGPWSRQRVLAILTRPLYWPLHSLAAAQALYELVLRPHFWAKTPHTPHLD